MHVFPRHAHRATRRLTLLACATIFLAPAGAHAASGGVTVGTSAATKPAATAPAKTKAKAAKKSSTAKPRSVSKGALHRAQALLRVSATGTHDKKTRSVVRRFQKYREFAQPTGIVDVATYTELQNAFALLQPSTATAASKTDAAAATGGAALGAPATSFALPANLAPITGTERAILDTIAKCESGGDIDIVSANKLYRGKYQFDKGTWKSVGGSGDPAEADESEQDQRAAILLRQRGTAPWPHCGRNAA